ncbi:MAG: ABATE domain-containing protein [Solirubrobacterales bacterium]
MPTSRSSRQPFRSGAGRLCLDFIRTLRHRGRSCAEEELATPERLASWIAQFGLCDTLPPAPAPEQVADAHALREAVNELITAARGPGGTASCPSGARQTVNTAAAAPIPVPHLRPDGQLRRRADDPIAAGLALIARDALALIDSEDLARIRACANADCRVLFIDHSRPGTRRWCSMQTCGNRAKKAAQRNRATGG